MTLQDFFKKRSESPFPTDLIPEVTVLHNRDSIVNCIRSAAVRNGVEPARLLAFALHETGATLNPLSTNAASGAKGLFQALPGWAKDYGILGQEYDVEASCDAAARSLIKSKDMPDPYYSYLIHNQGARGAQLILLAAKGEGPLPANIRRNMLAQPGYKGAEISDRQLATDFVKVQRQAFLQHYKRAQNLLARVAV